MSTGKAVVWSEGTRLRTSYLQTNRGWPMRPNHEQPTPGELEVLKILWLKGPSTVRQVMEVLNETRTRAYTSVMSLLNVMDAKNLVDRTPEGRAFRYEAAMEQETTLGRLAQDLLVRAFEGSASALVSQVLQQSDLSIEELAEIEKAIAVYREEKSG